MRLARCRESKNVALCPPSKGFAFATCQRDSQGGAKRGSYEPTPKAARAAQLGELSVSAADA